MMSSPRRRQNKFLYLQGEASTHDDGTKPVDVEEYWLGVKERIAEISIQVELVVTLDLPQSSRTS